MPRVAVQLDRGTGTWDRDVTWDHAPQVMTTVQAIHLDVGIGENVDLGETLLTREHDFDTINNLVGLEVESVDHGVGHEHPGRITDYLALDIDILPYCGHV
jgi:hypothetical protein